MNLTIRLPSGIVLTLGQYVAAWRRALEAPGDEEFRRWDRFPETAERILAEIRRGVHARINRHLPWYDQGRKWAEGWQRDAERFARAVNTPRLIVRDRECPRDLRGRVRPSRLATADDL